MNEQPQYFIGFNGPPGAGKDTLANGLANNPWIAQHFLVHQVKFAATLKAAVHTLFGVEATEAEKDQPSPYGPTWRQLYIGMSEAYAKKVTDNESIFGHILVERMKLGLASSQKPTLWLASDCGFEPEQYPVITHLGSDQVKYIQVHRDGCSFSGDSRGWINPGPQMLEYWNIMGSALDAQTDFNFHVLQLINDWGWSR
jgi:hypothetical protein